MALIDEWTEQTDTDNRYEYLYVEEPDLIIIGGNVTQAISLPFKYSELASAAKIIYSQGIEYLFDIDVAESMITEIGDKTIITVNLTPEQTSLFSYNYLEALCQIKIISKQNKLFYNMPREIKLIAPLPETAEETE